MALITIKDLFKSYNGTPVLKGVNLEIEEGETFVILGRSGAGKSVLLRQIIGLEKPDRGEITIGSAVVSKMSEKERLKTLLNVGMLFQSSALFDSMTVKENTGFFLYQHKNELTFQEIEAKVKEALALVGLEGTENMMPSDLSGGMKKRAALARLIVYDPKVLLYDEPTTGLDPITSMQINELIVRIQKKLKATSIVVTHDLGSAFYIADKIALHHQGEILHISKKEDFIQNQDPLIQEFLNSAKIMEKR
jgi:phospholipid/cholesterol/gamma-HCH transport system ATP-binding protein